MCCLLLSLLITGSIPAHTTVADNSLVAFILETALTCDTVTHEGNDFIRYIDLPVTDEIGWPEVPMLTYLVAIPDGVDPEVTWAMTGEIEHTDCPIYPAPKDTVIYVCTPEVVEVFRQDSTAYAGTGWWPSERVRVAADTRICDQRLLLIEVYPVSFRASDSMISTVSGFSIAVSFDSTEAVWSEVGLGPFQGMTERSSIIGYHPVQQSQAPVPAVFRNFDLITGPARVPGYVILTATGLDGDWIDDLAEHRAFRGGMDVAVVTTGEVMDEFAPSAPVLTSGIIRDFTEAMWEWGDGSVKPFYLLLVGDHEDDIYGNQPWFLPTYQYDGGSGFLNNKLANDEWFVYFNQDREVSNSFPDMITGRLCVKGADTLALMIGNIIDLEEPVTSAPPVGNRRRIVRLAGRSHYMNGVFLEEYMNWKPTREWTRDFSDWLDYDYSSIYCGDGRDYTSSDGSLLSSADWTAACNSEFSEGAGVIFYSDHGDFHMFSAGLEWWPGLAPWNLGAHDSTFNCIEAGNLIPSANHSAPFALFLCCGAGTFNHTQYLHPAGNGHPILCRGIRNDSLIYDFGTDCLAEAFHKNTDCPSAGVFAGSLSSGVDICSKYGKGILNAVYGYGESRLGDAIASGRIQFIEYFCVGNGVYRSEMGQFNLLGDPALDIGDRVRYPGKCDLVITEADIAPAAYPAQAPGGSDMTFSITVRNNGGTASGNFVLRVTVSDEIQSQVINMTCDALDQGEEQVCTVLWENTWFTPPGDLTVQAHADPAGQCDDSWSANNDAVTTVHIADFYPSEEGWPVYSTGIVNHPPILVDLDADDDLEIVLASGPIIEALDTDGSLLWRNTEISIPHLVPPLAADLDEDGEVEIVAMSFDGLHVLDRSGNEIGFLELSFIGSPAVGDMDSGAGLEIAVPEGDYLRMYRWSPSTGQLIMVKEVDFPLNDPPTEMRVICTDLFEDGYAESVYHCGYPGSEAAPPVPAYTAIAVYDWVAEDVLSWRLWERTSFPSYVSLSVGELSQVESICFPRGGYTPGESSPAWLIDPLSGADPDDCAHGNQFSSAMWYGLIVDWRPLIPGTDAFIIPGENQCLAWDEDGEPFPVGLWPVDFPEPGEYQAAGVTPPALGDMDGDAVADIICSTSKEGLGTLLGYDRMGDILEDLGFPFTLPGVVQVSSGFSMADIDMDGSIEVVFGTADGLLHCWEFGSCSTGYAPWPQPRHDAGRTGVLQ